MATAVPMCKAMGILPLAELRAALEAHGKTLSETEFAEYPAPVHCELAADHELDGAHCVVVEEWDNGAEYLWWRWPANGKGEFASAPACEAESDGDDPQACFLRARHPREHSWQVAPKDIRPLSAEQRLRAAVGQANACSRGELL